MFVYWLMFLMPAVGALHETKNSRGRGARTSNREFTWFWMLVIFALFIGCRFQVGGDWQNYIDNLEEASGRTFFQSIALGDPGYRLLEWLANELGFGIVGINLAAGVLFTYGLSVFCRNLPRPWLALSVAVPYLVIVVAMGYTRQGMAIGCAMIGLVALSKRKLSSFLIWVLIGATFHKSAVLLFPVAALSTTRRRLFGVLWTGAFAIGAYFLMLEPAVEDLRRNYVDAEYQSSGAMIRLLMNAVPALIFLWKRRKFEMAAEERKLWTCLSLVAFALFGVFFLTPASTAVDRVALYILPLQLVVFAHLPDVLAKGRGGSHQIIYLTLFYYVLVEVVWLVFAENSIYWVPYHFYLLQS
jgi:hypothetical protein